MTDDHTDISIDYSDNSAETTDRVEHEDNIAQKNLNDGILPPDHRSKDTVMTNPIDPDETLSRFFYLETLLRRANLEDPTPVDERSEAQETAIDQDFDARILTYAPPSLAAAGLSLDSDDWSISDGYVLALVLKFVRGFSYRDLANHLDTRESTWRQLDFDGGDSKSTFHDRFGRLNNTQQEIIKVAAIKAVHTAYRSGVPFPMDVRDRYAAKEHAGLPLKSGHKEAIEDGYIADPDFDAALDNWAEQFLNDCLLPTIEFDRTNPQYPMASFIGLFTHAAIEGESLRDAAKTVGREVGYDPVPNEDTAMEPIRDASVRSIEGMFQDALASFFDGASEYGVLEEQKLLVLDPTDVPRFGPEITDPWAKGNGPNLKGEVTPAKTDQKWEFGVLTFADPELYFVTGLFPLGKDLDQGDLLTRILQPAIRDISPSVDKLVMDCGLFGSKLVRRCRHILENDWLLRAPSHEVADILASATDGEHDFIEGADIEILNKLDETPNAVVVALDPWESINDNSHLVLLTDLPEDKVDPADIKEDYQNRNRIEFTIGFLKHKFDIPHNKDVCTEIEYFTRYLSVLFYNHWVQVNNCLSPTYALPLGANHFASANQVLHAIRDAAFEIASRQMNTE